MSFMDGYGNHSTSRAYLNSSLWASRCFFRVAFEEKSFPHKSHCWRISWWALVTCLLSSYSSVYVLGHCIHLNALSVSWIFRCRVRLDFRWKTVPHVPHLCPGVACGVDGSSWVSSSPMTVLFLLSSTEVTEQWSNAATPLTSPISISKDESILKKRMQNVVKIGKCKWLNSMD